MKENKRNLVICLSAFIVPVLILVFVYAARKVFPFGNNSVLVLDLNAQYIYFYEAFRDVFFNGGSLLYSFGRTLGGNFVGIYAYYLASPFSFILLIFPKTLITEAVYAMILFKVGAASMAFAYYILKAKGGSITKTIMFSIMYSLMSYAIVQTMNPMWLDGLILLPLIILSLERFVDKEESTFLVLLLALLFVSNFYIGYMTGVFVFLYLLYYLFGKKDEMTSRGKWVSVLKFIGLALLAVGLASFLLLPTYSALSLGKLTFTEPSFLPIQKSDLFDIFTKMLPMVYDSINYHGHPFIFSGTLSLLLLPLFFISKASQKEKITSGLFLGFMVACFMISTLDLVLHGFQFPNWLNYRYSFIFSFFVLVISYEAFDNLKELKMPHLATTAMVVIFMIVLTGKFEYEYLNPETVIWPAILLVLIYSFLISSDLKGRHTKLVSITLVLLVATEMGFNAYFIIDGAHKEVYYSNRPSYRDYLDRLYPLVDFMKENDEGFYRSETVIKRSVNDPMALGIYGVSNSSSMLNSRVITFLHKLGFASQEHWTRYKGATPLIDSIMGIKYIISEENPNNLYESRYEENGLTLYENPYALPIAFRADKSIKTLQLNSIDPFINQNALLSFLLDDEYTEYFKLVNIKEIVFENMNAVQNEGYVAYHAINPDLNAHIEYILDSYGENDMYMYLYAEYPRKVNIWLNQEYVDTFYDYESDCIIYLGSHSEEKDVSLITTPIEDEYFLNNNMFYYLDTPLFTAAMEELGGKDTKVRKISETKLQISTFSEDQEILFTTIPYEPGWRIKLNGKKVEPIQILDSLMAIELNEGQNEIEMKFVPSGLYEGITISLLSSLILTGIVLLKRKN